MIEAEKEIQKRIELEQARSRERLERARREVEAGIAGEAQVVQESMARAMEVAAQEAEQRAGEIIQKAAARTERLGRLDDESLMKIIVKQIHRILP